MMSVGMSLSGYKVGGGEAESGWEMMADEEEEVKLTLQKLQVGPYIKIYTLKSIFVTPEEAQSPVCPVPAHSVARAHAVCVGADTITTPWGAAAAGAPASPGRGRSAAGLSGPPAADLLALNFNLAWKRIWCC